MLRPCHFDQSADRVVIAPPETQSNPRHRLQASRPCGLISELEQENDQPKSGRRWWIAPIPFASEPAVGEGCLRNLNRWNSRQYSIIEEPCSHKKRLHKLTPVQPSDTFSALDFSGALFCRTAEPVCTSGLRLVIHLEGSRLKARRETNPFICSHCSEVYGPTRILSMNSRNNHSNYTICCESRNLIGEIFGSLSASR
jgi:hypothetical protein